MVKLPDMGDLTLAAADAALVAAAKNRYSNSLGASWVNGPCERQSWYKLRHVRMPVFDAAALKRFEDGHAVEAAVIRRLRLAITWLDIDPETNWQYGFSDFGGMFKGFYDGLCQGLIQAPTKWHVGEVKASAKWADLGKAVAKVGEKNGLLEWNPVYYGQAQLYMHYTGFDRHYMVAASPGAREWTSCRTDYDPVYAMKLRAKAERIIFSESAPPRIADTPTSFGCRFCDFADICHGEALPNRECRSCVHITPHRDGRGWVCERGKPLVPCEEHRYNPSMLNMQQTDVRSDGAVVYRMKNGGEYVDCGKAM